MSRLFFLLYDARVAVWSSGEGMCHRLRPAFPLFMMKNKSTKNPPRTQLLQMWIFRGFFVDSFKKTEVEFWGFVDFSWIFRGFVGGFFVDFSWIHLKPCGFFMDSVGGFTLDLVWIWGGFPGFPLWRKWEIRFRIFGDTFRLRQNPKQRPPVSTLQQSTAFRRKCRFPRALQLNGKT